MAEAARGREVPAVVGVLQGEREKLSTAALLGVARGGVEEGPQVAEIHQHVAAHEAVVGIVLFERVQQVHRPHVHVAASLRRQLRHPRAQVHAPPLDLVAFAGTGRARRLLQGVPEREAGEPGAAAQVDALHGAVSLTRGGKVRRESGGDEFGGSAFESFAQVVVVARGVVVVQGLEVVDRSAGRRVCVAERREPKGGALVGGIQSQRGAKRPSGRLGVL
mmetsp:Transcript_20400/g.63081  ORF Transcript_20400/g.63081 Transcript_20400/m.63081 type:complete len:220 (-) Transcript_20400:458-1117(-)